MSNNLYKKILFITSLIIFVGLGFLFIDNKFGVALAEEDGLQSSVSVDKDKNDGNFSLKEFSLLNNISIDVSFFQSAIFRRLKDNSVFLENVTPGRSNPFIPFTQAPTTSNNQTGTTEAGVAKSN